MVDMRGLQVGVTGLVIVVISVVLGVIITSQITTSAVVDDGDGLANTSNTLTTIGTNGSDILAQIITTWGSIILLGLVVVFIFVGILAALNLLNSGRR